VLATPYHCQSVSFDGDQVAIANTLLLSSLLLLLLLLEQLINFDCDAHAIRTRIGNRNLG